jgi:serine/threonine protein kinase
LTIDDATLRHLRDVALRPDLSATRYEIVEPLGRGGMGVVYRVRDRELDREVALKVLQGVGRDEAARRATEARVLARLEHPGIVPVHDAGVLPDGRPFYTMKLVRGSRLDALAPTLATVPERLRLLLRVADAVAFAHAHGVVHRDLTPANVMVGPFGEVLVLDWGVARVGRPDRATEDDGEPARPAGRPAAPRDGTAHGTVVGTPGFMAPEQARGDREAVGPHTDVFALGALLDWLLAPERGGPARRPRPLQSIVARATAADPGARYPAAEAFAADLLRYLDGEPVSAHRETAGERVLRLARRYRVAILLVLGYLIMRIALLLARGV